MNPTYDKRRLRIIVFVGIGFILLIIGLFIFQLSQRDDGVDIKGLDSATKDVSEVTRQSILESLSNILKRNSPEGLDVSSIKDVVIRDGTVDQEQQIRGREYRGSFIVDIPSLKQSYRLQYASSDEQGTLYTGGYAVVALCLPEELLIYEPFNCQDIVSTESGDIDPVIKLTPYSSLEFEVKAVRDGDKTTLEVRLLPTSADYRTGINAAIDGYKKKFLSWLTSHSLDPKNYEITYSY